MKVLDGEDREVTAFGKELTEQTVGVLIGRPLPGAAGLGEEHALEEVRGDQVMTRHLRALVPRQGASSLDWDGFEDGPDGFDQSVGAVPVREMHKSQEPTAPTDQGADRRPAGPTDDEVPLAVTDPSAGLDDVGPAVNEQRRRDESGLRSWRAATLPQCRPERSLAVNALVSPPLPPRSSAR